MKGALISDGANKIAVFLVSPYRAAPLQNFKIFQIKY